MTQTTPHDAKASRAPISSWILADRPRERILAKGANHLSASELLAVCLGVGRAGEDAVALARRLLQELGGLDGVLQAPARVLLAIPGLGQAKVARLKALHELTIRHSEEVLQRQADIRVTDSAVVARYLQRQLGFAEREIFACMFLDTRHRLLLFEPLFQGSINRAHVHSREVLRRAIELNAAAIVVAHNHPSGVAEPSQADVQLTGELFDLLARVDIRLLDHVIVARSETVSLASRGLIPNPNAAI